MLSAHLQAVIADNAGAISEEACNRPADEVMESQAFKEFADEIRRELPTLRDIDILRHMILVY